jgi:hypothetical protein
LATYAVNAGGMELRSFRKKIWLEKSCARVAPIVSSWCNVCCETQEPAAQFNHRLGEAVTEANNFQHCIC